MRNSVIRVLSVSELLCGCRKLSGLGYVSEDSCYSPRGGGLFKRIEEILGFRFSLVFRCQNSSNLF